MIEKTGLVSEPEVIEPEPAVIVEPQVPVVINQAPVISEIVERPEEEGLSDTEITNLRAGFDVKDFIEKNKDILIPVSYSELQIGDEVFVYGKDVKGELKVTNKYSNTLFFENIIKKEKGDNRIETLNAKNLKKNQIYWVNDVFTAYGNSTISPEGNSSEPVTNYDEFKTPFDKDFKEDLKETISRSIDIKINSLSEVSVVGKDNKLYLSYKIKNNDKTKDTVDVVFGVSEDGKKLIIEKSEREGQPFETPNLEINMNELIKDENPIQAIQIEENEITTFE